MCNLSCLSPRTLLTLPVLGQNFPLFLIYLIGNAAFSLEYGCFHSDLVTCSNQCGAFFNTLSFLSAFPSYIYLISYLIESIASQNLSS